MNDKRPALTPELSASDFRSYYWLKDELVRFCGQQGIRRSGSKTEINARIETYLEEGCLPEHGRVRSKSSRSGGGASRPELKAAPGLDTVLGRDYTNSQANRAFFISIIGPGFHFTTRFMRFCRDHPEKTFGDAVAEWYAERAAKKGGKREPIAPQFEYNRFIRAYFENTPDGRFDDAVRAWHEHKQSRR